MSEYKLLAITLLLWGTSNLAEANTNGDNLASYKYEIVQRVDTLNMNVPDLRLKTRLQPVNVPAAMQTLSDVLKLENALKGVEEVEPHSLTTLSCARALCFDGGDQ